MAATCNDAWACNTLWTPGSPVYSDVHTQNTALELLNALSTVTGQLPGNGTLQPQASISVQPQMSVTVQPQASVTVTLTTTNFVTLTATSLATLTVTKTDKCIKTDQSDLPTETPGPIPTDEPTETYVLPTGTAVPTETPGPIPTDDPQTYVLPTGTAAPTETDEPTETGYELPDNYPSATLGVEPPFNSDPNKNPDYESGSKMTSSTLISVLMGLFLFG
jgi:hypothetical protein